MKKLYEVIYEHDVTTTYKAIVEADSREEAEEKIKDCDFIEEEETGYQGVEIRVENVRELGRQVTDTVVLEKALKDYAEEVLNIANEVKTKGIDGTTPHDIWYLGRGVQSLGEHVMEEMRGNNG